MPAYLIVVAHVHDRDAFLRGYAPAAAELVERLGGQYVVRAPGAVVLEGAGRDGGSVVVSQWPDMAALRAFWDGPDYARIRPLREGIADCQVLAVESAAAPVGDGEAERAAAIADIGCRRTVEGRLCRRRHGGDARSVRAGLPGQP